MAKRVAWAIGGLGVGGVLGWIALGGIMWGGVAEAVTGLDSRALLLALGAVLFAGMMEAYRWKLLLPSESVSTARLFLVRNTGNGLNNFSPVRVVAEVVQTAMLRYGDGVSTEKVVSSLVISRLFDLLVTVNLVGAGEKVVSSLVISRLFDLLVTVNLVGAVGRSEAHGASTVGHDLDGAHSGSIAGEMDAPISVDRSPWRRRDMASVYERAHIKRQTDVGLSAAHIAVMDVDRHSRLARGGSCRYRLTLLANVYGDSGGDPFFGRSTCTTGGSRRLRVRSDFDTRPVFR